jgi:hypothetical protein
MRCAKNQFGACNNNMKCNAIKCINVHKQGRRGKPTTQYIKGEPKAQSNLTRTKTIHKTCCE